MGLIKWVFRFVGCIVLAAGTVLAVGDAARSLASDRVRLMTISEARQIIGMDDAAENSLPTASGVFASDGRTAGLSAVLDRQPASVVLGLTGLVLLALGRPRQRLGRTGTSRIGKV